jgi:hypothetical protein
MQICVFSDDKYEYLHPEDKNKAIRGTVLVGGWYCQKISETETRVTLILEMNLMGNLPAWVVKKSNSAQGG